MTTPNLTLPTIESEHVEFKVSFSDEVIITLVAFSNSKGGTVYIGITDLGQVKGFRLGKETIAQWINEIKNKTVPILIPDIEEITFEGKTVVTLRVKEYPVKPVSIKGRYYKRTGNSNHLMSVAAQSRNKLIAWAFKEAGLIERYGSGIPRIHKICRDYGIKAPLLDETSNGFKITLFKEKAMLGDKLGDKLTENQKLIVTELRMNHSISLAQLSKKIGISQTAVENNINKLRKGGIIQRIGTTKKGSWIVNLKDDK